MNLKDLLRQLGEAIAERPRYVGGALICSRCALDLEDSDDLELCSVCKSWTHRYCQYAHRCPRCKACLFVPPYEHACPPGPGRTQPDVESPSEVW